MSMGKAVAAVVAAVMVAAGGGAVAYATGSFSFGNHNGGGLVPGATSPVTPTSSASPSETPEPSTDTTPTDTDKEDPVPPPEPKVTEKPKPKLLMGLEGRGDGIRSVEARLVQLGLMNKRWVDGYFGTTTRDAVTSFQKKHDLEVLGYVDQSTLDELRSVTHKPTHDELYPPKPKVDPGKAKLDSRCLEGRVICIDKTSRNLYWVIDGEIKQSMNARFGCKSTPTREGTFYIWGKVRHGYSKWYDSAMPYSLFFSKSQAVHYSSDFDRRGYAGCSHGCVNIRNMPKLAQVFAEARVGDKVVVYWS